MTELSTIASIQQFKQMRELKNVHDAAIAGAVAAWQDDSTKHLVLIPELAIVFARILNSWIEDAMRFARNEAFYRELLDQCAQHLGPEAFTDDEGNVHTDPIRLKIPELVRNITARDPSDTEPWNPASEPPQSHLKFIWIKWQPHDTNKQPNVSLGYYWYKDRFFITTDDDKDDQSVSDIGTIIGWKPLIAPAP